MRALKIAGAAVAAILAVLVLLLMIGIPSGFLTSEIQARVERDSGYRLTIAGATKIGLWPSLNVSLSDVTLEAPKDHDGRTRMTIGSVRADITLKSLWAGHPQITEIEIVRPVLYRPLLRERDSQAAAASTSPKSTGGSDGPMIDRIKITDGSMVLSNVRDRVENRIEDINADIRIDKDRNVKVTGNARARASNQPLKFELKAALPPAPLERQNIPVQLAFEAPGALQAPLSAKAEVRLNGNIIMVNGLTGTLGDGAFNGWASFDVASKPLVKVDLDFQRLDLAAAKTQASRNAQGTQPWSDATIDLNGLNYVDAQVRISAAELDIGQMRLAPVTIDARLASGVLKASFPNLRAYEGLISGQVAIDASTSNPSYALAIDMVGMRALPLLQSVADFDKLDGRMQAKISGRSSGNSQHAIMANLNGSVFVNFQDGAIRGLNVAQMIRSLTASTLSGWQEGQQNTDLTQLSASFRVDKGQATSNDLNLVGPLVRITGAGTIDLAAQTLAFRVEPKLVMTTEGQGRVADPVGLGVPVVIDGPWSQPRIYPEMAGILDNPDAAYAKLKEMGKGLFGPDSGGLGSALGSMLGGAAAPGGTGPGAGTAPGGQPEFGKLGETLGNMFQGFGQGQRPNQSRGIPAEPSQAPAAAAPAVQAPAPAASNAPPQDSPAMNDVLRQLFNR